jgi:hypothetical protein
VRRDHTILSLSPLVVRYINPKTREFQYPLILSILMTRSGDSGRGE